MTSPCHEGLKLDTKVREEAQLRLLTIRGHVEGVLRMLEEESIYCVDVLKQVKAISGALEKVRRMVLRSHIKEHVVTAASRGDVEEIVEEMMEILKYR